MHSQETLKAIYDLQGRLLTKANFDDNTRITLREQIQNFVDTYDMDFYNQRRKGATHA